jgi:hypothetical protein
MMRTAALLPGLLVLFAVGAFASDNPFLKPEKRQPEKPVVVAPAPVTMVNGVAVPAPVAPPEEKAVVGAKLVAVINGEEVWLKNEDKTYVRQKARDESKIKLQEANQSAPEMPGLPVIEAGRPQNSKQ